MRNRALIILLFATFLFNGCIVRNRVLYKKYDKKEVKIDGFFTNIEITDLRFNISDKELHIPFISMPWEEDEITPILTEKQKQFIEKEISQYFSLTSNPIKVKCSVLNANQKFEANFISNKLYASVSLKIELFDIYDKIINAAISDIHLRVSDSMESYQLIERLYNKAIDDAIYNCFKNMNQLVKLPEN